MPLSARERQIRFQHLSSDDVLEMFCTAAADENLDLILSCALESYARRMMDTWDINTEVSIALAGALIWYSPSAKSVVKAVEIIPDPFREYLEKQLVIFCDTNCFPERSDLLGEAIELFALEPNVSLVRDPFIFYRLRLSILRRDLDQCVSTVSELQGRYKNSYLRDYYNITIAALLWASLIANNSREEIDFSIKVLDRISGEIELLFHALMIDGLGPDYEDWRFIPKVRYDLEKLWQKKPHIFKDWLYMVVEMRINDVFFLVSQKVSDFFDFDFDVGPMALPEKKMKIFKGESNSFLSHATWCGTRRITLWAKNQKNMYKSKWAI